MRDSGRASQRAGAGVDNAARGRWCHRETPRQEGTELHRRDERGGVSLIPHLWGEGGYTDTRVLFPPEVRVGKW